MPTLEEAVAGGALELIDGNLDASDQPFRRLYIMPRAVRWLDEILPTISIDGYHGGAPIPEQQADDLFFQFIANEAMVVEWPPHAMSPDESGIWELRTADLRFFGWFPQKGSFVISAADTKARCVDLRLYAGYRDQAVRDRDVLQINNGEFVSGKREDVL